MKILICVNVFEREKVNFLQFSEKYEVLDTFLSSWKCRDLMFMLEIIFSNLLKQSQTIAMTDSLNETHFYKHTTKKNIINLNKIIKIK